MSTRRNIIMAGLVFAGLVSLACQSEQPNSEQQIQLIAHSPEVPYTVKWTVSGCNVLNAGKEQTEPVASPDWHITRTYATGAKCKIRLTIVIPKPNERAFVKIADGPDTRTAYVKPGANAASVTKETEH